MDAHVGELTEELSQVLQRTDTDKIKEIIYQLLQDPSKIVLRTTRVEELPFDKVGTFFNVEHHVLAATSFFRTYQTFGAKTRAVVFGHKQQGKTQFLYFVTKLLQALGEGVVYLDKSIAPAERMEVAKVKRKTCCLHEWQKELVAFLGQKQCAETVNKALAQFADDGKPGSFRDFFVVLEDFTENTEARVWMIVDEAATEEISSFPIVLPKDQDPSNFHFVLTGSVGIARFTSDRHLDKAVWDLPLFSPSEAATLAEKLHAALPKLEGVDVDLWDALGVKKSQANAALDLENLGATL
jgi:hypothetical protein